MTLSASILLFLFAAPLAAAPCGEVAFEGRPFPHGTIVAVSGKRSFRANLEQGRFCLDGAPAGGYSLSLLPLGHEQPVPLTPPAARLLRDALLGADGRSWRGTIAASTGPAVLEGNLRGCPGPALVLARIDRSPDPANPETGFGLAWAEGQGESLPYRMAVPAGRVRSIEAASPGWGVVSQAPGLWDGNSDAFLMVPGKAAQVDLRLRPAGRLTGRIVPPPGVLTEKVPLLARVEGILGDFLQISAVGPDGRFGFPAVASGWRLLSFQAHGRSPVALPASRAVWVDAGASTETLILADLPGFVRIAIEGLEAPLKVRIGARNEAERWVIGLPAGTALPQEASRFLFPDEAPFAFMQDAQGDWEPMGSFEGREPPEGQRIPAGAYDVWLVAVGNPLKQASAVALAPPLRLSVAAGSTSRLSIRGARGTAAARGCLPLPPAPPAGPGTFGSLGEMHRALVPRVDFKTADGAWAGTVFLTLPEKDIRALGEALDSGKADAIMKVTAARPRTFQIDGLPEGAVRTDGAGEEGACASR